MVKVLLLGGHGKVALRITKRLVANSHQVVSVIRNPAHKQEILDFVGSFGSGSVIPTLQSLEEITDQQISGLLEGVKWVVWSAGETYLHLFSGTRINVGKVLAARVDRKGPQRLTSMLQTDLLQHH